ncbi:hypothetical protein CYMTET_48529 [Cymbomonas tetramitiformis]|uniref:Uncharacterized protein n=1 Tax=Cymbomonas tetramitiformis TaxID=36881 RepID=A0AAE0EWP8_9CHLO|nr:hypothetical protein CYMTET_48529 [Cymbomonas tetramitiformis]
MWLHGTHHATLQGVFVFLDKLKQYRQHPGRLACTTQGAAAATGAKSLRGAQAVLKLAQEMEALPCSSWRRRWKRCRAQAGAGDGSADVLKLAQEMEALPCSSWRWKRCRAQAGAGDGSAEAAACGAGDCIGCCGNRESTAARQTIDFAQ